MVVCTPVYGGGGKSCIFPCLVGVEQLDRKTMHIKDGVVCSTIECYLITPPGGVEMPHFLYTRQSVLL